jgi:hypothetical protein
MSRVMPALLTSVDRTDVFFDRGDAGLGRVVVGHVARIGAEVVALVTGGGQPFNWDCQGNTW